jgi:hypothetical protein
VNISVTNKAPSSTCCSELNEYLQLPVENVKDALKWWVNNQKIYPNFAHMALNYPSIPGVNLSLVLHWLDLTLRLATSTAIEHVFSWGWQLLHFTCNRLSTSSIWAYLCLGLWAQHDLLLMENLLDAIKLKKRKQAS